MIINRKGIADDHASHLAKTYHFASCLPTFLLDALLSLPAILMSIRNRYALIDPTPPPLGVLPRDETLVRLEDGTRSVESEPGDATVEGNAHEEGSVAVASRESGERETPSSSVQPEADANANRSTLNPMTVESSWISVQDHD